MFETVAIIVAVLIVGLLGYASMRPDTFAIQRSILVKASPEVIFPYINDLKLQGAWSPWDKLDPGMKRTHSGAAEGQGAVYAWEGNRNVGSGRLSITSSSPPRGAVMRLEMFKPFKGDNIVEFTLTPTDAGTEVTWAMRGAQPFMAKLMSIVMNCEKMVGPQFEAGLRSLKGVIEKDGAATH